MRKKKYIVCLTDEERNRLSSLIKKGKHSARELNRAHILLLSEQQKEDEEIAQLVGVTGQTVRNIRKRFFQNGLGEAIKEKQRSGAPPKLDIKGEAYAIATACSSPPEGRTSWTMQMIADKLVELKYVDSISDETVRLRLKKRR